jgi:hypothetical protein
VFQASLEAPKFQGQSTAMADYVASGEGPPQRVQKIGNVSNIDMVRTSFICPSPRYLSLVGATQTKHEKA